MKMIAAIIAFGFLSPTAMAQVNLDSQISVSQSGDFVFNSISEPNIAYWFPQSLGRISDVKIASVGERIVVQFAVGVHAFEFSRIDELLAAAGKTGMKTQVMRALEAKVEILENTDIEARFRPRLKVNGDARGLSGPVRYTLSVLNIRRGKKNITHEMLKSFFGTTGFDQLAMVSVKFNSIVLGAPRESQTAIPIFVSQKNPFLPFPDELKSQRGYSLQMPIQLTVVENSQTGCWGKPKPSVICLK